MCSRWSPTAVCCRARYSTAARHGAVNVHFSLLPKLRGAAPVQWALANGEDGDRCHDVPSGRWARHGRHPDVTASRDHAGRACPGAPRPARVGGRGAPRRDAGRAGLGLDPPGSAGSSPVRPRRRSSPARTGIGIRRGARASSRGVSVGSIRGRVCGRCCAAGESGSPRHARFPARKRTRRPAACSRWSTTSLRLACSGGTVVSVDSVQLEGGRAMRALEAVNGRLVQPGDRLERPEPSA